jgi:hypothetical protein
MIRLGVRGRLNDDTGEDTTMEKRRAEVVIDRPADEIWQRVGDFGDISWIPNTEECTFDGVSRKVGRKAWDFVLEQHLDHYDAAERTYTYSLPAPLSFESLIGPGKIVHTLTGTLAVTPKGDGASTVTWDIETEDFLIGGVHDEYQNALDVLKAALER